MHHDTDANLGETVRLIQLSPYMMHMHTQYMLALKLSYHENDDTPFIRLLFLCHRSHMV